MNLRQALERLLDRYRPQLLQGDLTPDGVPNPVIPVTPYDRARRRGTKDQVQQQASRARRYERYAQVKALQAQGRNILQIAQETRLSRQTVRKYIAADTFPEQPARKRRQSILDPYVNYLQERWQAGCQDTRQLWQEIQQRGFSGSMRMVWLWVMARREPLGPGRPTARPVRIFTPPQTPTNSQTIALPASSRLVWLLVQPLAELDEDQKRLQQYLRRLPPLDTAWSLTQQFLAIVRQRQAPLLQPWLDACLTSGLAELASFAQGLQRELR